jgi:hypothetical protein
LRVRLEGWRGAKEGSEEGEGKAVAAAAEEEEEEGGRAKKAEEAGGKAVGVVGSCFSFGMGIGVDREGRF